MSELKLGFPMKGIIRAEEIIRRAQGVEATRKVGTKLPHIDVTAPFPLPAPKHGGKVYRSKRGTFEVYGAILAKYLGLGGPDSYLGYPCSDEMNAGEGGRLTTFQRGTIFWWPDTGAIDMGDVIVRCVGVHAFGITDGPGSDEIYAQFNVIAPTNAVALGTSVLRDVDAGETHGFGLDLYRGKPAGLILTSTLWEHDSGDPEQALRRLQEGVDKTMEAGEDALEYIPVFGPILSDIHDELVTAEVKNWIAKALADLFGVLDDNLGVQTVMLSMKRMVTVAADSPSRSEWGWAFDVESDLFGGDGGSYKLLFAISRG